MPNPNVTTPVFLRHPVVVCEPIIYDKTAFMAHRVHIIKIN